MAKLLGKGSFGCFYEGNPLGIKKETKLVKLMTQKDNWQEEIENLSKIKKIKGNSIVNEDFLKNNVDNLTDVEKNIIYKLCDLSKSEINEANEIYEIIYNQMTKGITIGNAIKKNKITLKKLFKLSCELYATLINYSKNRLLHNDIKYDNIIYIPNKNKLYFIDFGVLTSFDDKLVFSNYYSPPEKFLLKFKYDKSKFIISFKKNFYELLNYQKNIINNYYDENDMNKDLEDLYLKYSFNKSLTDDDKTKIDTFMLSLTLFKLFIVKYEKYENNKFIKLFLEKIIIPGIRFNNDKRLDIHAKDFIKLLKTFKMPNFYY